MPIQPPDFDSIFAGGMTFSDPDFEGGLAAHVALDDIGMLTVPTGQIYACDPLVELFDDAEPFTATVASGTYKVQVARARWDGGVDHRVIAARLVIRDEPIATWELAIRHGQDVAALGETEMVGYGVDTASGCFVDASASAVFSALTVDGDEGPIWDALVCGDGCAIATVIEAPGTSHTIAVFNTGWGDGCYPTWVGRTADGAIACFVTDFFVVPDDRSGQDYEENPES